MWPPGAPEHPEHPSHPPQRHPSSSWPARPHKRPGYGLACAERLRRPSLQGTASTSLSSASRRLIAGGVASAVSQPPRLTSLLRHPPQQQPSRPRNQVQGCRPHRPMCCPVSPRPRLSESSQAEQRQPAPPLHHSTVILMRQRCVSSRLTRTARSRWALSAQQPRVGCAASCLPKAALPWSRRIRLLTAALAQHVPLHVFFMRRWCATATQRTRRTSQRRPSRTRSSHRRCCRSDEPH